MFLQINNLEKFYGEKDNRVQVLKGLSTGIGKGEICVLLGPSGSGKSTLLNIIGGIESYDKGEIIINGAAMSAMNEKQMTLYRREHLGYVFQFYNLIPNLTVKENIEVGAYLGSNPLDVDDLFIHLDFGSIRIRFQASFPAVSSSVHPSVVPSSRIRICCSAMSQPAPLITIPPRIF